MSYEISTVGALIGLALSIVLIMKKIPPAYGLILGAVVGGLLGGGGLTDTVAMMIEGVRDMISPVLRILTSGRRRGVDRPRSTDKIAEVIVKKCGQRHAISAIAVATMVICAIGVFIPIAVITVAPIAIAIGIRAGLSKTGIL
ncbi:MAG: GntP family permease, partial [Eubacterium sp.]